MRGAAGKIRAATALMLALLVFGTLLAGMLRRSSERFDIGDYSAADVAAVREVWEQSGENADLVALLKVLSYRYVVLGEEDLAPELRSRGQELLDRAKAGEADLEALDDKRGALLQVLAVIRELGAK